MSEYNLILRFDDPTPSYTYGFEAGIIWALMETGVENINRPIREENIEVIQRMGSRLGYRTDLKPTMGGWLDLEATKL